MLSGAGPGPRCERMSRARFLTRSAIVVANRAPHELRPEGGFTRGAGGVITALLTLAEVTAAEWVACAQTDAEREVIAHKAPPLVSRSFWARHDFTT
jgi:hypothetical protein